MTLPHNNGTWTKMLELILLNSIYFKIFSPAGRESVVQWGKHMNLEVRRPELDSYSTT